MTYARPENLSEVLALLSQSDWHILAGGTDFYPALRDRSVKDPVLDITAVNALRKLALVGGYWHIGAAVTWSQLIAADLPRAFDGLKLAAREVGSVQIQNRATVAGNICNASPAADGVPPLLTLDAEVEISSTKGIRHVPLHDFISGNRETNRERHELVTALRIPQASTTGRASFIKLGARRYLVISIAMVACRLSINAARRIDTAAISIGACSAVAQRLTKFEQRLLGQPIGAAKSMAPTDAELSNLTPIDDVRASADYRAFAASELVRQSVAATAQEF